MIQSCVRLNKTSMIIKYSKKVNITVKKDENDFWIMEALSLKTAAWETTLEETHNSFFMYLFLTICWHRDRVKWDDICQQ